MTHFSQSFLSKSSMLVNIVTAFTLSAYVSLNVSQSNLLFLRRPIAKDAETILYCTTLF